MKWPHSANWLISANEDASFDAVRQRYILLESLLSTTYIAGSTTRSPGNWHDLCLCLWVVRKLDQKIRDTNLDEEEVIQDGLGKAGIQRGSDGRGDQLIYPRPGVNPPGKISTRWASPAGADAGRPVLLLGAFTPLALIPSPQQGEGSERGGVTD